MDRRRLQIKNKIGEITDEKNLLRLNLDKLIDQIQSCADLLNGSKKVKQKECSLILNFELEVLKKLIGINYELECVLDESPLNQLEQTCLLDGYPCTTLKLAKSRSDISTVVETQSVDFSQEPELSLKVENTSEVSERQDLETSSQDIEFSKLASAYVQFPEFNFTDDTNADEGNSNVQILRDTLKKCSEKLGLDQECFSTMTDFYRKPRDCDTKCCEIVQNGLDDATLDLDKPINNVTSRTDNVDLQVASCSSSGISNNPTFSTICNGDIKENVPEDLTTKPTRNKIYTVDYSFSTDTSCTNGTETSSVTDEASNRLIPIVDQNDVVISHVIDNSRPETDKNAKPTLNSVIYTAIEKLNNTKIFDRQAEAVAKMMPLYKPDVTLKPTEFRINNIFNTNERKSKKKNKKNKMKDNVFYELKPKSTPRVDMQCAFSHVESPDEFYLHMVDEESVCIDDLTEQLNRQFANSQSEYNTKKDAHDAIGTFCISYVHSYESWYRARVINWELESKSDDVVVQFVDYGDKRRTSYKNLRRMTKEMSEIPMLAVRCHLTQMYPPQSTRYHRLTDWPMATIDALMELSGLMVEEDGTKGKIFRIAYACQDGDSLSIELHNLQDTEEHTVGQILLDLGLAVEIIGEYEEGDADLEYFLQDVDTMERADNINEAVMGYDPRDEVRICRFSKSDGSCYKGKHCKLEHAPMSKDGFTTDQIPVFTHAMYPLPLPGNGQTITIIITGYKDVCNFYGHIISKVHKEKNYMIDEDLYRLLVDMNCAKTVQTYDTFKVYPAIGEIVAVYHWSRRWLRGVVREQFKRDSDEGMEYQVYTMDFGEYVRVPLEDLRKIKPHHLQLPFQALEFYLYNYKAKEDCDKNKAKKYFLQNMYYHNFVAKIMSSELPLRMAVTTFDERDVGRTLAAEGFAVERTDDHHPVDGCFLEVY